MGMGIETRETPDTTGLPEFFITDIFTEICGPNVRVVCGVRRNGTIHWLYSAVMPADRIIVGAQECANAGSEAYSLMRLIDRRVSH